MKLSSMFLFMLLSFLIIYAQEKHDPYLWLEDINSEKAMEWVHAQNKITVDAIQSHPLFSEIKTNILNILNSKERIAYPSIHGKYVTNS